MYLNAPIKHALKIFSNIFKCNTFKCTNQMVAKSVLQSSYADYYGHK